MRFLNAAFLMVALSLSLTIHGAAIEAAEPYGDMHKMMERSFRLTEVRDKQKATIKRATSRTVTMKNYVALGPRGTIEYCIETDLDRGTGAVTSKIVVKTRSSEAVEDDNNALPSSPRRTGSARKRQWNGYTLQYYRKDALMELGSSYSDSLTRKARFGSVEELAIPVDVAELMKPVRVGSGITVHLHSKISPEMRLEIPFAFLVGYFAKLTGENFLPEKDEGLIGKIRGAISAQAMSKG